MAYLEPVKRLVITLGYRDDEESYPVKLHCIPLGKVDMKAGDFRALEASMAKATGKHRNIICHELYVTGGSDFTMVLMTHEASEVTQRLPVFRLRCACQQGKRIDEICD